MTWIKKKLFNLAWISFLLPLGEAPLQVDKKETFNFPPSFLSRSYESTYENNILYRTNLLTATQSQPKCSYYCLRLQDFKIEIKFLDLTS